MSSYEIYQLALLAGIIGLATVFGGIIGVMTSWLMNSAERRRRKKEQNNNHLK